MAFHYLFKDIMWEAGIEAFIVPDFPALGNYVTISKPLGNIK